MSDYEDEEPQWEVEVEATVIFRVILTAPTDDNALDRATQNAKDGFYRPLDVKIVSANAEQVARHEPGDPMDQETSK